jgi:hypothetical protein
VTALRGGLSVVSALGRGAIATSSAVRQSLSNRAQRKHEINLAKIQAGALSESRRPPAPWAAAAPAPAVPTVVTFAPQILQTTVVKVINKQGGGCGCSGCGGILLLILIGLLAAAIYPSLNPEHTTSPMNASPPGAAADPTNAAPAAADPTNAAPAPADSTNDKADSEKRQREQEEKKRASEEASFRVWTSTTGAFKTEARIASLANDIATLVKRDGQKKQVPLDKLSEADQEFIKQWRKMIANSPSAVADSSNTPGAAADSTNELWTKSHVPAWVRSLDPKVRRAFGNMMHDSSPLYTGIFCDGNSTKAYINRSEWRQLTRFQASNHLGVVAAVLPHMDDTVIEFIDDSSGETLVQFTPTQSSDSIQIVHP